MILRVHTNKETFDIATAAKVSIDEILTQLEQGNLIFIETIYGTSFVLNCLNINAIEFLSSETKSPPISN